MQGSENTIQFSRFAVPQKVTDVHKAFIQAGRSIQNTSFVLNRNIFITLAKDILFFSRLNLLTKADVQQIREELIDMLYNLESIAASGIWNVDKEISFYLSNMDFESSYTYIECQDFELSILRVFSFGSITSSKSNVCQAHKQWVDSLKRSSTLISRSGDVHRAEYFNEQRELLNTIL